MSPFEEPLLRSLADRDVVLLDAGGTLVTLDYERVREVLRPAGVQPTDAVLDRAESGARRWADQAVRARASREELWEGYFGRMLAAAGVPGAAIPEALAALWRLNREQGLWRRPVPGAKETLARLQRAGRRLAVVSNAEGQVEADLIAAGFGAYLETVVDSFVVGVAKPDPRIFGICLARMGAGADQALYVGDVPAFDVVGARAAGIEPVLLDPHGLHKELTDVVRIRRIEELPGLLGLSD